MVPHHHTDKNHEHSDKIPTELDTAELREYIEHNIQHLEGHVKSFTKIQTKIEDLHAAESLQNAIKLLKQGVLELKNVLIHLDE